MIPHSQLLINNLLLLVWRTPLSPGLMIVLKKLYPRDTFRSLVININIAAIQKCEWEISSTNECKVLKCCMVADLWKTNFYEINFYPKIKRQQIYNAKARAYQHVIHYCCQFLYSSSSLFLSYWTNPVVWSKYCFISRTKLSGVMFIYGPSFIKPWVILKLRFS